MNTKIRWRGMLSGFGVIALSLGTLLGASTLAHAAPVIDDPTKLGTLHFHKFTQPDLLGTEATGLELPATDTADLEPLAGVTFTAYPVTGLNLTTNAGWLAASTLTVEMVEDQNRVDTAGAFASAPTDEFGNTSISDLPLGLYYVTESDTIAGVVPAAPFLVFVPLTDQVNGDTWLYDIHIYPKSSESGGTKTVEDADVVKIGDVLHWTILADIPKSSAGIDGFKIVDNFDSKVTPNWSGAGAPVVSLTADTTAGVVELALVEGNDYTLSGQPSRNMVFEFTATGLQKLDQRWQGTSGSTPAAPKSQVQVLVSAVINEVGSVFNESLIYPNKGSFDSHPITPPPPESRLGDIQLLKLKSGTENDSTPTALSGAEFQVYASKADAKANTNAISISTNPNTDKSVWVTDSNGITTISGLRASNWADGAELAPTHPDYRTYWVKEIKAPVGYQLLVEPIEVHVLTTADNTEFVRTEVLNSPRIELPLTGAGGTVLFTVAGLFVIAGGAALLIRPRRATR